MESAELMRDAIEKKLLLDVKKKQQERIEQHFDDFEKDITKLVFLGRNLIPKVCICHWVSLRRCFLILSTAIKPKLSMNSLL